MHLVGWQRGKTARSRQNVAVFVAHRAIRCHFLAAILPLLPPITRNVTFAEAAKRLEFSIREEIARDAPSKSGKNGNVDQDSQHCRTGKCALAALSPMLWPDRKSTRLNSSHPSISYAVFC